MDKAKRQFARLFATTFVSAFLFIFGAGTLAAMFAPVVIDVVTPDFIYNPKLTVAAAREEAFLDINQIPAKQLFPPLSSPESVASGDWIRIPAIDLNVPLAL